MLAFRHPLQLTKSPKGSTVKWVLKNNNLLVGREELTAVVMNDPFPAGFEVDSEATAESNADYYTLKTILQENLSSNFKITIMFYQLFLTKSYLIAQH